MAQELDPVWFSTSGFTVECRIKLDHFKDGSLGEEMLANMVIRIKN